jgi:hypothetical protein
VTALRGLAALVVSLVRVYVGDRVCLSCGAYTDHVSHGSYLTWRRMGVLPCRCGAALQTPAEVAS